MAQKTSQIQAFLETFMILPFDACAGKEFARIKVELQQKGTPLADMDMMIASICKANGGILVTNNIKHFEKIEGLPLENWSERS